jgi:endonuclease III
MALSRRYRDFAHHNRSNPFDELLFILCSIQTQEDGYRGTHAALRRRFPSFASLAKASARRIAEPLKPGGLHRTKSRTIRKLCGIIRGRLGALTLAPLKRMGDAECESFLLSLPGVGKKVARCVMMYSLDRRVFPVDTHCWRISRRLGWVRPTSADGSCSPRDMDRLQEKIPPRLRFSLHVNMISLGREFCATTAPRCAACPLSPLCPKIGIRLARVERS